MRPISRRTLGGLFGGGLVSAWNPARAMDPVRRTGKPLIKLAVAAYSLRQLLESKGGKPAAMTLEQFAEFAAGLGLGAIEPTSYYFTDTSNAYMARYKQFCTRLGLDISGTAVGNDFTTPDAAKQKSQMAQVVAWIEKCSILGGKTIRIFAGNLPQGETLQKAQQRCIGVIGEACDHAAKYGVILALENHGGITAKADDLLTLVRGINHANFGINLDTGNFHTADPYGDLEKLAPYAVVVQVKTEVQQAGKAKEPADLKRLVTMLEKVSFRGYLALEHEADEEPREGVARAIGQLQKLVGNQA